MNANLKPAPARIVVLASGGGSNLQAILDHFDALGAARSGDVVLVASNRTNAYALERARKYGIATHHISTSDDATELLALLEAYAIDMIVLAGYLKLIPDAVTTRYRGRIINVHPGPLPAFGGTGMYGERVHAAVLATGAAQTGVTVHFVDEAYDHGAVISHWPVPVLPGDTPQTLGARVLRMEHLVYPRVIDTLSAVIVSERESV
jgi:formyltetrahydrofolate-dependent phosphoribosylglycinamide formyltransferase